MAAQEQAVKHTQRNLLIFVIVIITIGWLGAGLDALLGTPPEESLGLLLWLISPLAVSFLLRFFAGDGWADLGIRPRLKENARWYLVSLLVYVVGTALVLLLGVTSGATALTGASMGAMSGAFAVAFGMLFFKNIFEEFGWRGYLAPKVYTLGWNTLAAHGFVGLVWAAWHVPYYLFLLAPADLASYTSRSMITFIPFVFVGLVAASIVYGEIRLLTHSVWPAVLMHAVGNACTTVLIQQGMIEMTGNREFLVTPGPEGVLSIIFIALVGVVLYRWRSQQAAS